MNLTDITYWRNGELISATDLNTIQYGLSFLDNKICDTIKISNTGEQYKTSQGYTISNTIIYDQTNSQSIITISPLPGQNIVGILTVANNTQSYPDLIYTIGSNRIFIPNYDLTGSVVYVTYFYTTSTLTFSTLFTNINISNAYYPAIYIFEYQGNGTFAVYEYPISTFSKYYSSNNSSTQIGTIFLDSDTNTTTSTNDGNVSFTMPSESLLSTYLVDAGDIFYFTLLVPEPQLFGNNLGIQGSLIINQDILPVLNGTSNIGSAGDSIFDSSTNQYVGVFKRQFNNIVGQHLYSDDIRSDIFYINQINNITDKRIFFNSVSGEIYPDNKDIYVQLDTYDEALNTGVSFKVGHHDNFSYNLNLTSIVNTINTTTLSNLSYPVEDISQTSTLQYRIGYFTNIPNIGDVVYLNKYAVIDYMISINPQLQFTTDSYNYAQITQTYVDTSGNSINISVNIQDYISSININNIEYYQFLIYNAKNVPYFSSGSINNFTSYTINFRTFLVPLINLNQDQTEIQVNGISNNANITLYSWNTSNDTISNQSLMTLSILDYADGIVEISPLNTSSQTLNTLISLTSLSFIYPTYKLSVKNDKLSIFTTNGYLAADSSINYITNNNKFPLVTYLQSGILNFDGTKSTQTVTLPFNISNLDVDILLMPLLWQYVNTSNQLVNAAMNLSYSKSGNSLNVTFTTSQNSLVTNSSTTTQNISTQLYQETFNSTNTYNNIWTTTSNVINAPSTNNIGFSIDLTNDILKISTSLLTNPSSLINETWRALNGSTQIGDFTITSYNGIETDIPTNISVLPSNINGLSWSQNGYGFNNGSPLSTFTNMFSTILPPFGSSNYSNFYSNINTSIDSSVGNSYWVITGFNLTAPIPTPVVNSNNRLTATVQTNSSGAPYVQLDWNGNSTSGYWITNLDYYRSTDNVNFTKIFSYTNYAGYYSNTSNDTTVSPNTTYYYYQIEDVTEGYDPLGSQQTNTVTVNVPASNITPIATTFTISGTVYDESSSLSLSGISIINYKTGAILTSTDNNGNYTISNLSSSITIIASSNNYTFTGQQRLISSASTGINFVGTYIQPTQPTVIAPTLSINGPSTITEGTSTTYSVSLSNGDASYNIVLNYNTGGGQTTNANSFTTDINGNVLTNLVGQTNKVYNFTMGLNIVDKVNENAQYNQSITATLINASTGQTVTSTTYSFTYVAVQQCQYTTPIITLAPNSSLTISSGTGINFSWTIKGCNTYFAEFSVSAITGGNSNDVIKLSEASTSLVNQVGNGTITVNITRGTTSPLDATYVLTANLYQQSSTSQSYITSISQTITVYANPPEPTGKLTNVVWNPSNGALVNPSTEYVSFIQYQNVQATIQIISQNNQFPSYTQAINASTNTSQSVPLYYNIVSLTYPATFSDTITVNLINNSNGSVLYTTSQSITVSVNYIPPTPNPILQLWNEQVTNEQEVFNYSINGSNYTTTLSFASKAPTTSIQANIQISSTILFDPSLNGGNSQIISIPSADIGDTITQAVALTTPGFLFIASQVNNAMNVNMKVIYSSSSGWLAAITFQNVSSVTDQVGMGQFSYSPPIIYLKYGTYTSSTTSTNNTMTALTSTSASDTSAYTTTTSINTSVGADTTGIVTATLNLYLPANDNNVQVYMNGNNVLSLLSQSNPTSNIVQYSGNIADYLVYGFNELQVYTDNAKNSGLYNATIMLNGTNVLSGTYVYYATYNLLAKNYSVQAYKYSISPIVKANTNLQMTQLVELQQTQTKATSTTYQLTSNYQSSNNPISFNISEPSNYMLKSITLYYGTNSSNLQSYTHIYNNTMNNQIVTIYCNPNPSTSTSVSPYSIKMIIDWGDGTSTNLTTASTASDTGTLTISYANIVSIESSSSQATLPAQGTIKYLILGKTV